MRIYPVMFVLGLVLGLGIGLLLAPTAGSESRHKLRERAGPTVERIRERAGPTIERLKERVRRGEDEE